MKILILSLASVLSVLGSSHITYAQSSNGESRGYQKPSLLDTENQGKDREAVPVSPELKLDRCNSDFKRCADISEAANTIKYVYENGRGKEATQKEALEKLTSREQCNETGRCSTDAQWDAGYSADNVKFIDRQAYLNDKPVVDVQAIVAQKTVYEGGKEKKKFFITIKGTEGDVDMETNKRAAFRSLPIKQGSPAEVPLGFMESANLLMSDPAFEELLKAIKQSSDQREDFEVLVTGHSLGGATATAVKAAIEDKLPDRNKARVQAITFGSPLAGNTEFKRLYGDRVTAIHIDGDPVSSVGNEIFATRIGTQYTFKIPDAQAEKKARFDAIWYSDAFKKYAAGEALTKEAVFGTHAAGYNTDRYSAVQRSGWNDFRNELMQRQLVGITQGGSSHIGSAAYYLGYTPNDDSIDRLGDAQKVQQFSGAYSKSLQQREEYTTPGSTTNLKAPVDVVLGWNQPPQYNLFLDLDSHLTGPTSLGGDSSVRFHTRYDDRGSTLTAPYVELYKDVRPDQGTFGSEQTRIQVLQDGVYRFYVHDYTNRNATLSNPSNALSNSGANVTVHNGQISTDQARESLGPIIGSAIPVPGGRSGNVWYVFQLDSRTGILKRVNVPFIYEADRAKVPRIGEP